MANCQKLFLDYVDIITPSKDQIQEMKTSREALETKIKKVVKDQLGLQVYFYTQGSGARDMRTIIIKADGTYDADRGVYLSANPDKNAKEIQEIIFNAVKDHTVDGAEHRLKCIRVLYKCAYNIDFPIYYLVEGESGAYIAVKDGNWVKDDPEKLIEWFKGYKDEDGQLIRIARSLKGWASEKKGKFRMPSGVALTVWAAKYFSGGISDRDDKCLLQVLESIQSNVWFNCSCTSPVEPWDDLVAKMTEDDKTQFRTALNDFITDAKAAVNETNQLKASELWRKHLGSRFPLGEDEDVELRAAALLAPASLVITHNARLNTQGRINGDTGVHHKEHRNYGH